MVGSALPEANLIRWMEDRVTRVNDSDAVAVQTGHVTRSTADPPAAALYSIIFFTKCLHSPAGGETRLLAVGCVSRVNKPAAIEQCLSVQIMCQGHGIQLAMQGKPPL